VSVIHVLAAGAIVVGSVASVAAQTGTTTTTTVERHTVAPLSLRPEQRRMIVRSVESEREIVPTGELEVRVGRRVPSTVVLSEFPRDVYVEEPRLERLRYFRVHGQVVLVDPETSEVVDIVE